MIDYLKRLKIYFLRHLREAPLHMKIYDLENCFQNKSIQI